MARNIPIPTLEVARRTSKANKAAHDAAHAELVAEHAAILRERVAKAVFKSTGFNTVVSFFSSEHSDVQWSILKIDAVKLVVKELEEKGYEVDLMPSLETIPPLDSLDPRHQSFGCFGISWAEDK